MLEVLRLMLTNIYYILRSALSVTELFPREIKGYKVEFIIFCYNKINLDLLNFASDLREIIFPNSG